MNSDVVALKLYHSSDKPVQIKDIMIPGPRVSCDFGDGFYLTQSKRVTEEWVVRESTPVLNVYDFSASKGAELQQAEERRTARRRDMEDELQIIRRQPVPGEKYIDDYLACGDFYEI